MLRHRSHYETGKCNDLALDIISVVMSVFKRELKSIFKVHFPWPTRTQVALFKGAATGNSEKLTSLSLTKHDFTLRQRKMFC